MATKRKAITKKTRFEVFKRDGFKCQYCGASAPEAVLVVDHINPVSKDGDHDVMNFITACQPCNAGKSDRLLDDNTVIKKQKLQLDDLNSRREQIEMMLQWRDGLKDITENQVEHIADYWGDAVEGYFLNENGKKQIRTLLKKYPITDIMTAIDTSVNQYPKRGADDLYTKESIELTWNKVGGILRIASLPEDIRALHYVKGILRNRLSYVPWAAMTELEASLEAGVTIETLKQAAKDCSSWNNFLAMVGV